MKNFLRKLTIQQKILGTLLPTLIIVVGFASFRLVQSQTAYLLEVENRKLEMLADKVEAELDNWLHEKMNDAARLAASENIRQAFLTGNMSLAADGLNRAYAVNDDYEAFFLADLNGLILYSTTFDAAQLKVDISQIPVYAESQFVELLTAETIARWVAHELSSGLGLLEEASLRAVLEFTEDAEHYAFLARVATAFDALAAFDDFAQQGKYLDAILITNSGKRDEKPLGIVTTFDIPTLIAAVDIRAGESTRRRR